jgi:type III secretory pathway component EscT
LRSDRRVIYPEIPLDFDDTVSHRHALLIRQSDGTFVLRDIGSSNDVNRKALDRTYAQEQSASLLFLSLVIISGLLLIGALVAIQLFLSNRMRRTLNPMLLAATAIAFIFLGFTTRAFLSASHNLKVAKEDAFESIQDLRKARSISYSANGDESRYLLDTAFASQHEQAFFI